MKDHNTGKRALKLVPPGKRRPERLKGTGRKSIETKLRGEYHRGNCTCISRNFSKSKIEHFILKNKHLILVIHVLNFSNFEKFYPHYYLAGYIGIYCDIL